MVRFSFSRFLPLLAGTLFLCGCANSGGAAADPPATAPDLTIKAVAVVKPGGAAATQPTNNNVTGTVTFTQTGSAVTFVADIDGLEPNTSHGFHIHDKGDLSDPKLAGAVKAISDFAKTPQSLTITLAPPSPVPVVAIKAMAAQGPQVLVDTLGLSITSNQ